MHDTAVADMMLIEYDFCRSTGLGVSPPTA